ncbi:MAG: hypothetical protein IPM82_08065 [Saprospiraceae bacterium]|nr:hypothetical protein [Saprospiraceae bacterium]
MPADLTLNPDIHRLHEQLVNAPTPEDKFALPCNSSPSVAPGHRNTPRCGFCG